MKLLLVYRFSFSISSNRYTSFCEMDVLLTTIPTIAACEPPNVSASSTKEVWVRERTVSWSIIRTFMPGTESIIFMT